MNSISHITIYIKCNWICDGRGTVGTVFSARSVGRGCKEDNLGTRVSSVRKFVRKRGSWKGDVFRGDLRA